MLPAIGRRNSHCRIGRLSVTGLRSIDLNSDVGEGFGVWAGSVAQYETLLLAELGYAEEVEVGGAPVAMMAVNRERLVAHVLGERRADVMAARERLVERLKRAVA